MPLGTLVGQVKGVRSSPFPPRDITSINILCPGSFAASLKNSRALAAAAAMMMMMIKSRSEKGAYCMLRDRSLSSPETKTTTSCNQPPLSRFLLLLLLSLPAHVPPSRSKLTSGEKVRAQCLRARDNYQPIDSRHRRLELFLDELERGSATCAAAPLVGRRVVRLCRLGLAVTLICRNRSAACGAPPAKLLGQRHSLLLVREICKCGSVDRIWPSSARDGARVGLAQFVEGERETSSFG